MICYWLTAILLFVSEVVSWLSPYEFNGTGLWETQRGLWIYEDLSILVLLGATELWLRREKKIYLKRAVLLCGLLLSYELYFLLGPVVHGSEIILMMPLLISLVYFERNLLRTFAILNILCYMLVTIIPAALHMTVFDIADFLLVMTLLVIGTLLGQGVITRSLEMRRAVESLAKSEQKLIVEKAISDKLLKMDALTGLYNHKTFHEYMENLIHHSEANGVSIHLAILDIDNFKTINDSFGHWVGDIVLKEVAGSMMELISPNDFAARYGGEEFALIFADTTSEQAENCCEAIRSAVERISIPHLEGRAVTISSGLCHYQPGDGKEMLFRHADDALYQAKRSGKNRVLVYQNQDKLLVPQI
ncbi:GGDEF domain-containing protein [Paenibacillus physcomitrellae]|nr:GGDEF domain-containing protein [Paenibacillus physcomitrellae]